MVKRKGTLLAESSIKRESELLKVRQRGRESPVALCIYHLDAGNPCTLGSVEYSIVKSNSRRLAQKVLAC